MQWKYKVYNKILDFFRENNVLYYPINLKKICSNNNWKIKYYAKNREQLMKISLDGFMVKSNDEYTIFINEKRPIQRQRFTLAHEIGHIFLEHRQNNNTVIANSELDNQLEKEANMFARLILCPPHITRLLPKDEEVVSKYFNVSKEMAKNTLNHTYLDYLNLNHTLYDEYFLNNIEEIQENFYNTDINFN